MGTSYGLQAAQVNEEPTSESFLNLVLTQHPCDEDLELRDVCVRLEVNPPFTCFINPKHPCYSLRPMFCYTP